MLETFGRENSTVKGCILGPMAKNILANLRMTDSRAEGFKLGPVVGNISANFRVGKLMARGLCTLDQVRNT